MCLGVGLEGRGGDDVNRQLERNARHVAVAQLVGHLAADEHRVRATADEP